MLQQTVFELLRDPEVDKFVRSPEFRDAKLPVDTAMCDNFKGWGNFAENCLGIPTNVCLLHGSGNCASIPNIIFEVLKLTLCTAGIAAANRSHLKFFSDIDAYGVYHDFVVETGAIAVEVFAERVQELIVTFLRKEYGDKCADWCETYWTGRLSST